MKKTTNVYIKKTFEFLESCEDGRRILNSNLKSEKINNEITHHALV
jgi:hypothetical protein